MSGGHNTDLRGGREPGNMSRGTISLWVPVGIQVTIQIENTGKVRRGQGQDPGMPRLRDMKHVSGIQGQLETGCVVLTQCGHLFFRLGGFRKWPLLGRQWSLGVVE